jgi:1-acyl-sn-glycerol-3-phosphate acyltransferase
MNYQHQGKHNIPSRGPFLIVANHMSVSDPVLIGIGTNRKVVFLAKEELFKNVFSAYFVRSFGAIPVYRGRFNREALNKTRSILAVGGVIGLFPEGQRSKTGSLITPQPGSALIASHNRVPILPVGITGTETIKGLGWLWHRPRVLINIGRPFYFPDTGKGINREQLDQYSDLIMQKIADLLPEKYRGVYIGNRQKHEN